MSDRTELESFSMFLGSRGVAVDASAIADFIAAKTLAPTCGHCGSSKVVAGDFKDEMLRDLTGARTVKPHPDSHGPAWVCECGAFTVRQ